MKTTGTKGTKKGPFGHPKLTDEEKAKRQRDAVETLHIELAKYYAKKGDGMKAAATMQKAKGTVEVVTLESLQDNLRKNAANCTDGINDKRFDEVDRSFYEGMRQGYRNVLFALEAEIGSYPAGIVPDKMNVKKDNITT